VTVDQRKLARERERAAVEQDRAVGRKRLRIGRVDAADQEERAGDGRERGEPLAAGRQEDAAPGLREQRGGLVQRGDLAPVDRRVAGKRRALEPQQLRVRLRAGRKRRPRHPLGERVCRVDDRVHALGADVRGQPVRPAEAADADLAGRQARGGDPSGERRDDARAAPAVQRGRERPRLAGAAEHEHRRHRVRPPL
jgi:hypothetical protein